MESTLFHRLTVCPIHLKRFHLAVNKSFTISFFDLKDGFGSDDRARSKLEGFMLGTKTEIKWF